MPDSSILCSSVRAVKNSKEPSQVRYLLPAACRSVLRAYLATHRITNSDSFVIVARGGLFFIPALLGEKLVNPFALLGPARESPPQLLVSPLEAIRNRHCHLLDIVVDSGGTLRHCAQVLQRAGSASVSAVAVFGHPESVKLIEEDSCISNAWIYDISNWRENGLIIPDAKYDVGDMFTFASTQGAV